MKYIIDKDGNITGKSFTDKIAGIEAPHKPLREDESCRWNGTEWEYTFRDYPIQELRAMLPISDITVKKDCLRYILDKLAFNIKPNIGTAMFGDEYKYHEGQRLTVLIPCWGKAKYIKDTVSSVLNNTLLPDSIIILLMDDDSIALKEDLAAMSSIIDCIEHERLDVASARNYLATLADSEWLMFLDADDLIDRYYIEALLKYEEPNSINAAVRSSLARRYDCIKQEYISEPDSTSYMLNDKVHNIINCTGTFICHKDIMHDYQFNPACSNACEDTCFFMNILKEHKYTSYLNNERMLTYKVHTDTSLCDQEDYNNKWVNAVIKYVLPIYYEQIIYYPDCYLSIKPLHSVIKSITDNNDFTAAFSFMLNDCSCAYKGMIKENVSLSLYNSITELFKESRERRPLEQYSKGKFTVIGKAPESIELDGTEFDVLIFNDITVNNSTDIFYKQGNMIINNSILEQVMQLDIPWYERLVYMLKNYCVICYGDLPEEEINLLSIDTQTQDALQKYNTCSIKGNNEILNSYLANMLNTAVSTDIKEPTRYVTFSLNRNCNKNCIYCNQLKADNIDEGTLYENFDRYLTMAENAYGSNLFPQLLGGEPTLLSYETQIKILERLKEYPMIRLFTNGYDKNAPLYRHPNVIKNVHATTLEQAAELIEETQELFTPVYVVTKDKLAEIEQWLDDNKELVKGKLQLIPCMNTGNIEYDISEEALITLSNMIKEYSLIDWACPMLTETIAQQRFDAARVQCPKNTPVLQIDCITGKVLPCCNYSAAVEVGIDEFDFSNPAKYYKTEACEKCITFSNYTR